MWLSWKSVSSATDVEYRALADVEGRMVEIENLFGTLFTFEYLLNYLDSEILKKYKYGTFTGTKFVYFYTIRQLHRVWLFPSDFLFYQQHGITRTLEHVIQGGSNMTGTNCYLFTHK
jgi:hypothetical protein